MLILPRNIQATCMLRRGMPTIFRLQGKFQSAKVGKFQPAETGEYSTGVDIERCQAPEAALVSDQEYCCFKPTTAQPPYV